MFSAIRHAYRVVVSHVREAHKDNERSPHWPSVKKDKLYAQSTCEACGGTKRLQVHHEKYILSGTS